MRVWWWLLGGLLLLTLVAAVPGQEGRPPSPLEPDYYSGTVTVQGFAPRGSTQLVACVETCTAYQSDPMSLDASGTFEWLKVAPNDHSLVADIVTFHIVNEHGSIQAAETGIHAAARNRFTVSLTFADPLPTQAPDPTPTPTPAPTPAPEPTPRPSRLPRPSPRRRPPRRPPRSRRPPRRPYCPSPATTP